MGRDMGVDGRAAAELHVVVGAGPIGSGIARALVAQGGRVRLITRSGSAPLEIALDESRVTVPSGLRETAQVTARESVPVGSREIEPGGERSAELTRYVRPASSAVVRLAKSHVSGR
jgi:3-hydroxyacyl-CoA dehydrogenase